MNVLETADELLDLAERLRREVTKPIRLDEGRMTLADADKVLSAVFKNFEIGLKIARRSYKPEAEIEWQIYAEGRNYRGPTLREAVALAMPRSEKDTLAGVEESLGDAGEPEYAGESPMAPPASAPV